MTDAERAERISHCKDATNGAVLFLTSIPDHERVITEELSANFGKAIKRMSETRDKRDPQLIEYNIKILGCAAYLHGLMKQQGKSLN